VVPIRLGGWRAAAAIAICILPVLLGFLVPVLQLLAWAAVTARKVIDLEFLRLLANSLALAVLVTLVTVVASVPIVYTARLHRNRVSATFSRLAAMSYALPGAVIAVSVYSLATKLDHGIHGVMGNFGVSTGLLISGSILAMTYGCIVRFMAVAVNPLEAGFERVCDRYDDASRSLGASPWRTLWRVDLRLLRGTLAAAGILVFVDTLKELPLTLMLRPSTRFDTLAVKSYELASKEQVPEAACAALVILAAGLIPVTLKNKRLISTDA
jgi:iron(III) transport system permease protein